jgi:hypothetical protein
MDWNATPRALPLHIERALQAATGACAAPDGGACHDAVMRLADAVIYYLGAVAVAEYSQALYTGAAEADPTLNRSLRSLRRVLPGQWLGWAARGLEAVTNPAVSGLKEWYLSPGAPEVARAYADLRGIMTEHLAYAGDYGPRDTVPPRIFLEMIDQYRIRRGKVPTDQLPADIDTRVAAAVLPGLRAMLDAAEFLRDYQPYAPQQRQLLVGTKPLVPMPPLTAPPDMPATILLYPPGEAPDYTKRPDFSKERLPVFPLDPLLAYLRCPECDRHRVAALTELANNTPTYTGLDPDCGHKLHRD